VAVYENSDLQKVDILKENKGKSGIYRWTNNATGKSYVGSSVNLYRRLRQYYDYSTLSDPKCNMLINRALFRKIWVFEL
jgi:excinuclease UvrABC nuclease subunit